MENNLPDNPIIKVGVIDDHPVFTSAVGDMIDRMPGFKTVIKALSGEELLQKLKEIEQLPDILLMDIGMEEMDGIEATRLVTARYSSIKIVALTIEVMFGKIIRMLRAGGCAYLTKHVTPEELEHALKEVFQKGKYHADIYNRKARELVEYEKEKMSVSFSENEIRFLDLIANELSHREIADIMKLSPHTIETYRAKLFEKLEVSTSIGMVLEALRRDLIRIN